MSSLQKFHRRTQPFGPATIPEIWPPTTIGEGGDTKGYWLGTAGNGTSKLIVAPKSTELPLQWGSFNTVRNTVSTTDGVSNTTTLYNFGSAAHPAAYYCKTLTSGGYNTWYLPAVNELMTLYSNKNATPFATANQFKDSYQAYWSSTESTATLAKRIGFTVGNISDDAKNAGNYNVRAVRRYL